MFDATPSKVLQSVISTILYLLKLPTSQFIWGSKIISDTQFFKKLFQCTLSQETILSVRNCIITKPTAVSLNTQSFVSLSVVKLNLEIRSQASRWLQEIIEHIVHSIFLIAIIGSLIFTSLYSSKSPSHRILLSGRREKEREAERAKELSQKSHAFTYHWPYLA